MYDICGALVELVTPSRRNYASSAARCELYHRITHPLIRVLKVEMVCCQAPKVRSSEHFEGGFNGCVAVSVRRAHALSARLAFRPESGKISTDALAIALSDFRFKKINLTPRRTSEVAIVEFADVEAAVICFASWCGRCDDKLMFCEFA